ncbi:hypothetical protein ACRRTK_024069 [Alexandromys fortis]
MAPIGRKRKAAPAETVDKREKLAEGPAHELTRLRAPRCCPEPGSAAGGPRAACAGEPLQAAEGQLRGDAAARGQQP